MGVRFAHPKPLFLNIKQCSISGSLGEQHNHESQLQNRQKLLPIAKRILAETQSFRHKFCAKFRDQR